MTLKPPDGESRRNDAHAILKAKRAVLVRKAQRALLQFLLCHDDATADDIRELVPTPAGVNPVAFGTVPTELTKAGQITANGWRKSTRPEAHARPVQVWVLVDRAAAAAWLTMHPEWSNEQIADKIGVARTSIYRFDKFKAARSVLKEGRQSYKEWQQT